MSGYKNFAVVGAGNLGSFVVRQLLKDKSAGIVNQVVVLTRQVSLASLGQTLPTHWQWQESKTTVEGDAKVIPVDYSKKQSIVAALAGVDVVICTIADTALGAVQAGIAEAAKEAGVKLFVPSEFGTKTEGLSEKGMLGTKADMQNHLKALGLPYTLFYTGNFSDLIWIPCASFHYV
jgi:uncharacterized protein YbjT (DUF2867 family)